MSDDADLDHVLASPSGNHPIPFTKGDALLLASILTAMHKTSLYNTRAIILALNGKDAEAFATLQKAIEETRASVDRSEKLQNRLKGR